MTEEDQTPCPECGIKPVYSKAGDLLIRCGGHYTIPIPPDQEAGHD